MNPLLKKALLFFLSSLFGQFRRHLQRKYVPYDKQPDGMPVLRHEQLF